MFRKCSIKNLAIVFTALLALVVITAVADHQRGENTLKNTLFSVNTEDVTAIRVFPRTTNGKEIELVHNNAGWQVRNEGKTFNGDNKTIASLIKQINQLKPLRLAATKKDKWEKYQVTDSTATRVMLMKDNNTLADIYLGRFSYLQPRNQMKQQNPYQQPQGTMNTYVRLGDEDEVYAVEGFLAMSFNRDANGFRDKTVVSGEKNKFSKLTFSYPADSSFTLIKNENTWMINGVAADSAAVAGYLSKIERLTCSSFNESIPQNFSHALKIEGTDMAPIEVKAAVEGNNVQFITSQNQKTAFKEDKSATFKKLFTSKEQLLK